MSYITDFKSPPFDIYNQTGLSSNYTGTVTVPANGYVGTGLNGNPDTSDTALLGSKWATEDGRTLTLCSNASTALVTGILAQTPAEITAFEKLAIPALATQVTGNPPVAGSAGSYQIIITNGSTVLKQSLFNGGYAIVAAGTGIGQTLKIASNPGSAISVSFTITLEDPIQTGLDNTSKISLIQSPFANVIISPATTATGGPVGATLYPVAASVAPTWDGTSGVMTATGTPQYFYVVSKGPTSILVDSTVTNVGYPIGVSKTTAGSVGVATLTTVPQIGISMQTLTSAQNGLIYLNL